MLVVCLLLSLSVSSVASRTIECYSNTDKFPGDVPRHIVQCSHPCYRKGTEEGCDQSSEHCTEGTGLKFCSLDKHVHVCCCDKPLCNDEFCADFSCPLDSTFKCKHVMNGETKDVGCDEGFCVRIDYYKDKNGSPINTTAGCDTGSDGGTRFCEKGVNSFAHCRMEKFSDDLYREICCCTTHLCNDGDCNKRACPCTKGQKMEL